MTDRTPQLAWNLHAAGEIEPAPSSPTWPFAPVDDATDSIRARDGKTFTLPVLPLKP